MIRFSVLRRVSTMTIPLCAVLALISLIGLSPILARADMQINAEMPVVTALLKNEMDQFDRLLRTGTQPNTTDTHGRPLILLAARDGLQQAVDILIRDHARVDQVDPNGDSALMWAAAQGHAAIVEKILAAGADYDRQNRQGFTALIRAVGNGRTRCVDILLKAGADPTITDYTGRGPMSWARNSRSSMVVRLLDQAGAVE